MADIIAAPNKTVAQAVLKIALVIWSSVYFTTSIKADWRYVESENFILYSEAKEIVTIDFLNKLERYRKFLVEHAGIRPNTGGLKLTIYFARSRARYKGLTGRRSSLGIFTLTQNGPITVTFQPEKRNRRATYKNDEQQTLFHEYVHFLQHQAVPTTYPLWYREGFAEYLSSVVFREKDTVLGQVLYGRARNLHHFDWYDVKDILDAKNFGERAYMFYAQAWLLTHMLYTLPEYRENISLFLGQLENNIDPASALKTAYKTDYEKLGERLRQYFDSGQLFALPYPMVKAETQILSNNKLSGYDSKLVDKSIRLAFSHSPRQYRSIAKSIKNELKKRPRNTNLGVALVEAQMGEGKWGLAQKTATDLLVQSPDLQFAKALLGEIILQRALNAQKKEEAEKPDESKLQQARQYLAEAAAKMPRNARVRKWYAGSYIYGGLSDFDSAANVINEAYTLYPQDWQIRRQYADLLFQRNDIENACKLYQALFNTSSDKDEKMRIKKRIEANREKSPTCDVELREETGNGDKKAAASNLLGQRSAYDNGKLIK